MAALGRGARDARGAWAGAAYALYWPAVEMPSWTMTENVHTFLLTAGVAVLASERLAAWRLRPAAGGFLLGPLRPGALRVHRVPGASCRSGRSCARRPRAWKPAAVSWRRRLAVILPWTARNVFLIGDAVLIESAAFENIWFANRFVDRATFQNQERLVHGQATPAEKRAAALHYALRGIRRHPGRFVQKIGIELPPLLPPRGPPQPGGDRAVLEPWRHAGSVLLDDLPLLWRFPSSRSSSPPAGPRPRGA